jgi:hypothetical protein
MDRFSETLLEETDHLAHSTEFQNVLVMYLTGNNPSLKWQLLYEAK